MENPNQRRRKPYFTPNITFGNILTLIVMAAGGFGFFLKYNDRLIAVEAAHVAKDRSDAEFKREILQRLTDLHVDVRELRASTGVSWRELPPSQYRRDR